MKIQKCNACKAVFHDTPWIDICPVCRSKNINHNEDEVEETQEIECNEIN